MKKLLKDNVLICTFSTRAKALHYYHWDEGRQEKQEISLTSGMISAASLVLKKTTLLGYPYTKCLTHGNHHLCDLITAARLVSAN